MEWWNSGMMDNWSVGFLEYWNGSGLCIAGFADCQLQIAN